MYEQLTITHSSRELMQSSLASQVSVSYVCSSLPLLVLGFMLICESLTRNWVEVEVGRGEESSHNSGCLGCPVKSTGLTVDWKRVHTHSYPVTWGWDWLPLTELMWKDKSMIVTSPLRGNPILAVYFPPLLTERSQPPISKRRGELYCASILNNLTNYFTKDEMFIPLYDNYLPNSSILVFVFRRS